MKKTGKHTCRVCVCDCIVKLSMKKLSDPTQPIHRGMKLGAESGFALVATIFVMVLLLLSARAEEVTLQGLVQDTSRNHLPGVKVVVEGTKQSTVSNNQGRFSLQVTSEKRTPLVLHLSKENYLTLKYIVKEPKELVKPYLTPIIDNDGLVSGTLDLSMSHAPHRLCTHVYH